MRVLKGKDVSGEGLLPSVGLRIANWASVSKEFPDFEIDKIMYNWGACLFLGNPKKRTNMYWCSLRKGSIKVNMDGAAHRKSGPAGIGDVLRNHNGEVLNVFSKHVGVKNSNELEILAILEALCIYR